MSSQEGPTENKSIWESTRRHHIIEMIWIAGLIALLGLFGSVDSALEIAVVFIYVIVGGGGMLILSLLTVFGTLKQGAWRKNRSGWSLLLGFIVVLVISVLNAAKNWNENTNISELEEVVKNHPQSADAHYRLGSAYDAKNIYDLAIQEYQEAVRLDPTNTYYKAGLSAEYCRGGDVKKAQETLEILKKSNAQETQQLSEYLRRACPQG